MAISGPLKNKSKLRVNEVIREYKAHLHAVS